jgi:hypothetical protein
MGFENDDAEFHYKVYYNDYGFSVGRRMHTVDTLKNVAVGEGHILGYSGVIINFVEQLSGSLPPLIYGDRNQTRDFTLLMLFC